MAPSKKRIKLSEGGDDRLSELPNSILIHILSNLKNNKQAIQPCILSTRWIHLWKFLPTLRLSCNGCFTLKGFALKRALKRFATFVSRVFSLRDSATADPCQFKRMLRYAVSHNIRRLKIDAESDVLPHFPPCFFSCQTLTSLSLHFGFGLSVAFLNSLKLPALTRLNLKRIAFLGGDDGRAEPFSGFKRLNELMFGCCRIRGAQKLCISNSTLVNLRIDAFCDPEFEIELSVPNLRNFAFTGVPFYNLFGGKMCILMRVPSSIQQVYIDACQVFESDDTPAVLINWLQQLADIRSLTVSLRTLEVLSSVPDFLKVKLPLFSNLKSLKVKMSPYGGIPDGMVDCLLQNAPFAKVSIVHTKRLW